MRAHSHRLLRLSLSSIHHHHHLLRRFSHILSTPHFPSPPFTPNQKAHFPKNPNFRSLSDLAPDPKPSDESSRFVDIFAKPSITSDEIKLQLDSSELVLTHDLVLQVLEGLGESPDVARRIFDWVSEARGELLSSKSYNYMCGILGSNGYANEFWDLVRVMKDKGFGVKRGTYNRVLEKFEKEGLDSELEKLKQLYDMGSDDSSAKKLGARICKVIRGQVWGDDVERELTELKAAYTSDLVALVLRNTGLEPNKALIFFRWIEESKLFEHDEGTYNAIVLVLGREDSVEKFWKVMYEMRGKGFDLDAETYVNVLGRFVNRKMMKDAVALYEFAMCGENKPSDQDFTFLLKKIVVSKELDMSLFERVVRTFKLAGNEIANSTLEAVIKSLTSVGRVEECNKVLKVMGEVGFSPSDGLRRKIAFTLSSQAKKEAVNEFMDNKETDRSDCKTWASLIEGYCLNGDITEASDCFHKMVENEGANGASYCLDMLVNLYNRQNRAMEAYKLLYGMVNEKELKVWHSTYKVLISKLLVQGGLDEALSLLGLMKNQGFPPFLDPFLEYVSKNGSADEAMKFLSATTVKRFPSTSLFLRVFEAYLKAGKHDEAHNLLSKSPRVVRNHGDVLNLFFAMKPDAEPAASSVAA